MAAQGDSISSIAAKNNILEQDLLSANPGVVTVRPGQVIALPKTGGGNMYSPTPVTNPFAGAGAKVGVGTVGGQPNLGNYNTSYNGFQTPTTNGFKAPQPYSGYTGTAGYGMQGTPLTPSQVNFQTPATNGFTTPGYTNLTPSQSQNIPRPAPQQPYLGASSYTNPALQPPTTQTQTSSPIMPVDEKGKPIPYTGNPNDPNTALWKKYWDASARAGVDLAGRNLTAPTVMTRDQIWQMKADQRRRQTASTGQDAAYNQPSYQYDTTGYGVGSPLVRNITWSIRG